MRGLTLASLVMGLMMHVTVHAQEQKVVYLNGAASTAMTGDNDAVVTEGGKNGALPNLLRAGWTIVSVNPSSDGKAHVVLIAPTHLLKKRQ